MEECEFYHWTAPALPSIGLSLRLLGRTLKPPLKLSCHTASPRLSINWNRVHNKYTRVPSKSVQHRQNDANQRLGTDLRLVVRLH
jgi:hypothetical protein